MKKITWLILTMIYTAFIYARPLVPTNKQSGKEDRRIWVETMLKISDPVLQNAANGTLKKNMPYESTDKKQERRRFSYLEALGRTLCGIAPWLEAEGDERVLKDKYRQLSRKALSNAVNPQSPDYMTFNEGTQPLVDAAYLSEGILRAPVQLWKNLDNQSRDNLLIALKQTRAIQPMESNWLLFASMIEATILELTGQCDTTRMLYGVKRFRDDFYKGDGVYGDGVPFHNDYYNSYVIHPMLLDILVVMERHHIPGHDFLAVERIRHARYAKTLERFIAPDGTYPVIGRSIAACRFGAFHSLSQAALLGLLPKEVSPAQVRCGLTAVILRQLERKDNFDDAGWLRVGFTGNQMRIAEPYVNTGSLYHCTTVFLALGLPSSHPFWNDPYTPWTSVRAWNGEEIDWDQPLKE